MCLKKNCVLFPGAFRWIYEGFEIAKQVGVVFDLDPQFQTNQRISFKMCVCFDNLIVLVVIWLHDRYG